MVEKTKFDTHINLFQSLLKRLIMSGAQANKYMWHPRKFSYNYFIIGNLSFLLKCLIIHGAPEFWEKAEWFIVENCAFLVEKLTVKYVFLAKRFFGFYSDRARWQSEKLAFKNLYLLFVRECQDFARELNQLEVLFEVILTSGCLMSDADSLMTFNLKLIQKIFETFLSIEQIDLDSDSSRECVIEFQKILTTVFVKKAGSRTILAEKIENDNTNIFDYRRQILTYLYLKSAKRLRLPFSLQELCRLQIRNSTREKRCVRYFDVSTNLKKFLVYE